MTMDAVVPPEISAELTQILSNLVLGDNDIRASAEKAVNERLAHTPELYLLALAQFAITADTEVMRSFSLVLLRRLLFRPAPSNAPALSQSPASTPTASAALGGASRVTLYDHLSNQTLSTLERLLLFALAHEPAQGVRKKAVDTVTDLAAQGMARGHGWHALQAQAFAMAHAGIDGHPGAGSASGDAVGANGQVPTALAVMQRETAFRIFSGCSNLVMDLQIDAVLGVFQRGLKDQESIEVRHAALLASTSFLSSADATQLAQSISLLSPMLDTLYELSTSLTSPPLGTPPGAQPKTSNYHHLSTFLGTLTPLASTHPILFAPHLQSLLKFLPSLILPLVDCGRTPTMNRPYPTSSRPSLGAGAGGEGGGSAFQFPPQPGSAGEGSVGGNGALGIDDEEGEDEYGNEDMEDADERSTLRLSALEFMVTLSEARPNMVRKVPGWTEVLVRACLEGMGELDEDESAGAGLEVWLREDPSTASSAAETDAPPALYEQSLDRLACALGGKSILPPAFHYIPSMMVSFDWRVRHAGLMAIAAIGEGTGKVMQKELQTIVDMVTPMFKDAHPRVRYAACQCVGQLCTDLEEVIQQRFHLQLFSVLIPALEDPEPRVHAHAASALINFCEGVARDTLLPYLDPIVERLLKLLNPGGDPAHVRRYVQEQAITTLAMVADASEVTFAKHYGTIMPLLLSVLRNADGPDYRKLRVKAMECAGLIAIAVGPDVFRPDSTTLIELLLRIQQGPVDTNDTQLSHYLMATWAKVCQAMGGEFETYLAAVMPMLLAAASAKTDLTVYDDEDYEERDGWETIVVDGNSYGVRTAAMDEKCQAFETLVIYCSTLGPRFAPYLGQTLQVTLPSLGFYYHEGVREACAMLIPMLLSCGKQSNTLTTEMVNTTFEHMIECIRTEQDSTFLASLYKYFSDAVRVLGGVAVLPAPLHEGIIDATKRQLQSLADRRKARAARVAAAVAGVGGLSGVAGGFGAGGAGGGDFDRDEMGLVEEIEDFALEDMGKMLVGFDANHPLLVAVSGVRELGMSACDDSDEDGEEDGES